MIEKRSIDLDWTRGRFKGRVIFIALQQGEVVQKVYLTSKGNLISVKLKDLGILTRFRRLVSA